MRLGHGTGSHLRTGRTVVALTLGTVVVTGILFAGVTVWHTRSLSNSYDEALKAELELKAYSSVLIADQFLTELGPEALETMQRILASGGSETTAAGLRFRNEILGFELWVPDVSAPGGYRRILAQDFSDRDASAGSEEIARDVLERTFETGQVAVAIDEEARILHGSMPMSLGEQGDAVAMVMFSSDDEFAFFAAQREDAIRNGIILSVAIVGFVSVLGGGLSYYVSRDLTDRQRAEEELRQSEARLQEAQRIAHLGNWDWNIETNAVWWSNEIYRIFGLAPQEFGATYDAFVDTVHPDDRETVEEAVNKALNERTPYSIDHRIVLPDGSGRVVHGQGKVTYDEAGKPDRMVGTVLDITVRKRFEDQLEHAANYDSLTDLFNRRRFEDELERALAQARRNTSDGALLLLDVDQFKDVNDSLGHGAGDELLVNLAGRLRETLRAADTIARLGGDEFSILLPDTDLRQASTVAARLLESVRDRPFDISGHRISITASIGIVMFPGPGTTAGEVLAQADLAMYQAKELGRDRFHTYIHEKDWPAEIESRLNWRNRIHEALENDRFLLHAQPILDLSRNEVSQYELLLRMTTEDGKILFPAEFLDIAERSGSMAAIERWVVRQAIQLIAQQRLEGEEPCFEVNLSARAFAEPEMVPIIRHELAMAGVNPASLVFEVTETTAVKNVTQAQEFVASLKALGCRFALDDFGIGISSFYLLKHLPVDYLKIDGSFVRDLPGSPVDQHLVRMMAEVARGLGIKTIAEHVSDEETLRLLREYGVDYAQGYHVGRPGPVSEVVSGAAKTVRRAA